MEAQHLRPMPEIANDVQHLEVVVRNEVIPTRRNSFLEGGRAEASLEEINKRHIILVFHRDNEP